MRFVTFSLINGAIANTNIASAAMDMSNILKASAQIVVTGGTATGTVKLQVSNDNSSNLFNNVVFTNWSDLGPAATITTTGVILIAEYEMCYRALRAVYTDGSGGTGTATLNVNIMAQGA